MRHGFGLLKEMNEQFFHHDADVPPAPASVNSQTEMPGEYNQFGVKYLNQPERNHQDLYDPHRCMKTNQNNERVAVRIDLTVEQDGQND